VGSLYQNSKCNFSLSHRIQNITALITPPRQQIQLSIVKVFSIHTVLGFKTMDTPAHTYMYYLLLNVYFNLENEVYITD